MIIKTPAKKKNYEYFKILEEKHTDLQGRTTLTTVIDGDIKKIKETEKDSVGSWKLVPVRNINHTTVDLQKLEVLARARKR